jgi:hypothetical protein
MMQDHTQQRSRMTTQELITLLAALRLAPTTYKAWARVAYGVETDTPDCWSELTPEQADDVRSRTLERYGPSR